MGALVQPSVFRQQPQQAVPLDTSNPLVPGLAHSWALNVRGPLALHDSTGKAHGVFGSGASGSPSGNSWRIGPQGYYVNFDDSGTGATTSLNLKVGDSNGSGSPGSQIFSVAARIRVPGFTSAAATIYGSVPGGIQVRIGGTGQVELIKEQTLVVGMSTGSVPIGVDVDIGVSYDGATASFYINGAPSGSTTNAQTFTLNGQHCLGYAEVVNERVLNGTRIYRLDVWGRTLPAAQFKAWSDNPWQMYKSPARRLWVAAGASPATIAATMAWTEAGDTASVGATVTDSAAAAWTEQGDSMAVGGFVATPGIAATVAWTEAGDTAAAAGTVTDRASVSWTEQGDSASIAGDVARAPEAVSAAVAWTEGSDSAAIAARATDRATIGFVEQGDTWNVQAVTDFTLTVRYADVTIMRFSRLQAVANLGPDRLQQTTGFP